MRDNKQNGGARRVFDNIGKHVDPGVTRLMVEILDRLTAIEDRLAEAEREPRVRKPMR